MTTCCRTSARRRTRRRAPTTTMAAAVRWACPTCSTDHPLHDAFIAGAQEAGYRYNADFNGAEQEGVGPLQLTVKGRRRCSTAVGYLKPVRSRPNLTVEVRALTHKVLLRRQARRRHRVQPERRDATRRRRSGRCCCAAAPSTRRNCCSYPASVPAGCCSRSGSRSSTTCPAWARTCRTISAGGSSTVASTAR